MTCLSDEDHFISSTPTFTAPTIVSGNNPYGCSTASAPVTHALPVADVRYNRLTKIRLLQSAANHPVLPSVMQLHIDGGANRSITPYRQALLHYRDIKPFHIRGVNADDPALTCTGFGYLPWRAPNGTTLLVRCYYSSVAADTIISPSDIVLNHMSSFKAWSQYSDLTSGTGYIDFIPNTTSTQDAEALRFPLTASNGLWFYHNEATLDYNPTSNNVNYQPIIQRLTSTGLYELHHARLGHAGTTVLSNIHKHVEGVPKLVPPPLFRCDTCLRTKATKRAITGAEVHAKLKQSDMPSDDPYTQQNPEAATNPETMDAGAHFHMDIGFVRGTKFSSRDEDGRLITSLDGYNSYILIIDRATRYTWVILTKSKIPQIDMLRKFLNMHGSKSAAQR